MDAGSGEANGKCTDSLSLIWHVTQKGFQGGSLLATFISIPTLYLRKSTTLSVPAVADAALRGGLAGATMTTALGLFKVSQLDKEAIADRVRRLKVNEGQNRTDFFAATGAEVGAAIALVAMARSGSSSASAAALKQVGGAACMGSAAGVLLHVGTSKKET